MIAVNATAAEWRALLAALPRCCQCPAAAECTLYGAKWCLTCATREHAPTEPVPYFDLLTRIETELGGFTA